MKIAPAGLSINLLITWGIRTAPAGLSINLLITWGIKTAPAGLSINLLITWGIRTAPAGLSINLLISNFTLGPFYASLSINSLLCYLPTVCILFPVDGKGGYKKGKFHEGGIVEAQQVLFYIFMIDGKIVLLERGGTRFSLRLLTVPLERGGTRISLTLPEIPPPKLNPSHVIK